MGVCVEPVQRDCPQGGWRWSPAQQDKSIFGTPPCKSPNSKCQDLMRAQRHHYCNTSQRELCPQDGCRWYRKPRASCITSIRKPKNPNSTYPQGLLKEPQKSLVEFDNIALSYQLLADFLQK